jgi:beta-lactamase class A
MRIDRRGIMAMGAVLGTAPGWALAQEPTPAPARRDPFARLIEPLGAEARLGLAIADTGTGRRLSVNATERFALASTFKMPLAAAILHRADRGRLKLDQPVRFGEADLLAHAPTVRAALPQGQLTLAELCEAAVVLSDNAAANLLLPQLGGPTGFTRWLREIGDRVTRLDREEPALNVVRGGDARDTTSPLAMLALMEKLLTGDVLSQGSRERLIGWMVASPTGKARLRAGLPDGWRAGDKTGTSGEGYYNDIAIVFPPARKPVLIAAYLDAPQAKPEQADQVHASIGRLVGQLFA